MQKLVLVGTSHRYVEPSRLGLLPSGDELRSRLASECAAGRLAGFIVIATCNRLECYLELADPKSACELPQTVLRELFDVPGTTSQGADVVRHLLRVAGSLESMVLGENQILGQVKCAWQRSQDDGHCSPLLHEAFRCAVTGAKEVRNATGLGEKPVSVASLAARHLTERLGEHAARPADAPRPRIACIGAGEMVRKAAPALALAFEGHCELLFVNRTQAKAEGLAREFGGRAMALADFVADPPACDVVLAAVWGKTPVVDRDLAERIAARREGEDGAGAPVELIDLGVPACIAPDLGADARFHLLDMDTLGAWSRRHASERRKAAARALPIVERHVAAFVTRQQSRKLRLSDVRDAHLHLAEESLRRLVEKQLRHLPDQDRDRIKQSFLDLAKAHAHLHLKDLRSIVAASAG